MNISIVVDFHELIHKSLSENQELAAKLQGIFKELDSSTKYPYLYHKVTSFKLDTDSLYTYEVEGEVNLYTRTPSDEEVKQILYLIEKSITTPSGFFLSFKLISSKIFQVEFINSADEITTRIKLKYLSLVQMIHNNWVYPRVGIYV
ncbi:MAG: hypothetical protein SFT68_04615 [Rickettsiaceae bacterium]|nr:hypothetical protein [Rickettsiaceae bacterium]